MNNQFARIEERFVAIVERVTFHNEQNGWSVIKVSPIKEPHRLVTVLIHQIKVFAGATMEFTGYWYTNFKYGEQFKATNAIERKPASSSAMEKYLGSGLIKGVGPAIAKRIVTFFGEKTLDIFENNIAELMKISGISLKKLELIKTSWEEHKTIRDVMIFLQNYGISTLLATKIFKQYGENAISTVTQNPYRLAHDIHGIGFYSADKIALALSFDRKGAARIGAGIRHVLDSSRDEGHCFLTKEQIVEKTLELLAENIGTVLVEEILEKMTLSGEIKKRENSYYAKTLFFDELSVSERIKLLLLNKIDRDEARIKNWVARYCAKNKIVLSTEQALAVSKIPSEPFSILTGGPGCGKTTCTKVLVKLLNAMKLTVTLAAPTGRAAQRMAEVIGIEAKTIHRLLEWVPALNGFKRNENNPIDTDFLIVDETSMLDISIASALLRAIRKETQVLFIGDKDQLPSVGAGSVLSDLLKVERIPRFTLTQVFRQASKSSIISFAHDINNGIVPRIASPVQNPDMLQEGYDTLFIDADEATQDQLAFIKKARAAVSYAQNTASPILMKSENNWTGEIRATERGIEIDKLYIPDLSNDEDIRKPVLIIPPKFRDAQLDKIVHKPDDISALKELLQKVHPWSTINFGLTALQTVIHVYTKSIKEWSKNLGEIQVLTPQVRGSLGTNNLNAHLQETCNPFSPTKKEIRIGERIFREGDRVIQTRNNYDLGVFNGDIGNITGIGTETPFCEVMYHGLEQKVVRYGQNDISDLALAYAITIHKSQGSEFQSVIIPVAGQHFNMLYRNLIYTALTRAKKLAVFIGSRKAFAMAIKTIDNRIRQTALDKLI